MTPWVIFLPRLFAFPRSFAATREGLTTTTRFTTRFAAVCTREVSCRRVTTRLAGTVAAAFCKDCVRLSPPGTRSVRREISVPGPGKPPTGPPGTPGTPGTPGGTGGPETGGGKRGGGEPAVSPAPPLRGKEPNDRSSVMSLFTRGKGSPVGSVFEKRLSGFVPGKGASSGSALLWSAMFWAEDTGLG